MFVSLTNNTLKIIYLNSEDLHLFVVNDTVNTMASVYNILTVLFEDKIEN